MSKERVKVLSIEMETSIPKKDGGTYTGTKIVYEKDGKTVTKGIHPNGLKFNEELRNQLVTLLGSGLPKDVVLHTEKAENGFNVNVVGILPADTPVESTRSSFTPKSTGGSSTGTSGGGNKDTSINRAVALKAAVESNTGSVESTVEVAKRFVTFLETGE